MNKPLVFSMLMASLAMSQSVSAKLYKWVDDNGRVHYGDKIPAEYSKNQHDVLNSRGDTVKSVGRMKTQEELMAERIALKAEQERQNKERLLKLQVAKQDKLLLDTFSNQRDIIIWRDDKLDSIQSSLRLTESYNQQLQTQLRKVTRRIESLETAGRTVPDGLSKQVEGIGQQMDKNNDLILRKTKEMAEIKRQFEEDMTRFRELKGITTPRPDLNNVKETKQDTSDTGAKLTKADVEKLIETMDQAVNDLDANAVASMLSENVEIVMDISSQGNTQTMTMNKQEYLTTLKQGWSAFEAYSYERTKLNIDMKNNKALLSFNVEEKMKVQGQNIEGTSKGEATVEMVGGKPLFTKMLANVSM